MWRRWRQSERHLYPWHYMTNGIVYAEDVIDLEVMEAIASELEKERDDNRERLEAKRLRRQ